VGAGVLTQSLMGSVLDEVVEARASKNKSATENTCLV
jgi:hypothetical protein